MKHLIVFIALITVVFFANAQQAATLATAQKPIPVMKTDVKNSTINAPVGEAKTSCAGKQAAHCSHDTKSCNKEGEAKAACCQKGSAQGCNHGSATKTQ